MERARIERIDHDVAPGVAIARGGLDVAGVPPLTTTAINWRTGITATRAEIEPAHADTSIRDDRGRRAIDWRAWHKDVDASQSRIIGDVHAGTLKVQNAVIVGDDGPIVLGGEVDTWEHRADDLAYLLVDARVDALEELDRLRVSHALYRW